jgi:hypothetical protein
MNGPHQTADRGSTSQSVQAARSKYERDKQKQRPYL